MKKFIVIISILFVSTAINHYSQNSIDPNVLPSGLLDTIINFNNNNIHYMDNEFVIGWNYGSANHALDELMHSNFYLSHWETGLAYNFSNYGNNQMWYMRLWPLSTGSDMSVVSCQSIYYEPTLTANKS